MPEKYKRCVKEVKAKGKSESSAHAICTSVNAGGIQQVRRSERREKMRKSHS